MKLRGLTLGILPRVAGVVTGNVDGRTVKKALASGADILELRVDTFRDRDPQRIKEAIKKLSARGIPLILTVRSKKEGGRNDLKDAERLALFSALTPAVHAVDIELGSGRILKDVVACARRHRKKVIVSYHDFRSTPGTKALSEKVRRARAAGADMVKVATLARGQDDLKRLAGLLVDSDDLIVIAMGGYGVASRIFFPILGSLLTYGSIMDTTVDKTMRATTASTAPGQLPVSTIKKELKVFGF
ncbi:MAG: type I 3-dehydroquinate dehydratase [Thermodesulfobacteriota bacterium]